MRWQFLRGTSRIDISDVFGRALLSSKDLVSRTCYISRKCSTKTHELVKIIQNIRSFSSFTYGTYHKQPHKIRIFPQSSLGSFLCSSYINENLYVKTGRVLTSFWDPKGLQQLKLLLHKKQVTCVIYEAQGILRVLLRALTWCLLVPFWLYNWLGKTY